MPEGGMWLSYLRLDAPAAGLRYDLAVDATGKAASSPVAAGLPAGGLARMLPPGSRALRWWSATVLGVLVAALAASRMLARRRTGLQT
jgi:hypothetical protein